jgi:hypothetical protein
VISGKKINVLPKYKAPEVAEAPAEAAPAAEAPAEPAAEAPAEEAKAA